MARATGIGGVFLRASNTSALAQWYSAALGIDFLDGAPFAIIPVDDPRSITVLAIFAHDDPYIGEPGRQAFMVNFRVDDLDGVIERLRGVGTIGEPIVEEENGRFSWTVDPQGNRIELWEPNGTD